MRHHPLNMHRADVEYQRLRDLVKRLAETLEDIVENDRHYPENAPIRKLLAEARQGN